MANLTTQQVAELLIGVARTQQAVVEAVESLKSGFRTTHFGPALDNAARIRVTNRPLTLQEFPARVLMQCMGRAGPNVEHVTRDLEALLAGQPAPTDAGAGGAAAGAGGAAAPAGDAPSLDMT